MMSERTQMLDETVPKSMLGLTDVEKATSEAADTVDQDDRRAGFICTSSNLVYCIRCSQSGLYYISETKHRLGDRFVQHLCSVHDKQHLPVANHFNSLSHSLGDMSILGLLQCHKDTTCKLEEQHLIFHPRNLQPYSL
eukprot:g31964.t1